MFNSSDSSENAAEQDGAKSNSDHFPGSHLSVASIVNSSQSVIPSKTTTTSVLRRWRRKEAQDSGTKHVQPKEPSKEVTSSSQCLTNHDRSGQMNPNAIPSNTFSPGSEILSTEETVCPVFVPHLSPLVPQSTARPYEHGVTRTFDGSGPRVHPDTGAYSRTSPGAQNKIQFESKVVEQPARYPPGLTQNPYYQPETPNRGRSTVFPVIPNISPGTVASQTEHRGNPLQQYNTLNSSTNSNPNHKNREYAYQNYVAARSPQELRETSVAANYPANRSSLDSTKVIPPQNSAEEFTKGSAYIHDVRIIQPAYSSTSSDRRSELKSSANRPSIAYQNEERMNFPAQQHFTTNRTGGSNGTADYVNQNYYQNKPSCVIQDTRTQNPPYPPDRFPNQLSPQNYNHNYLASKTGQLNLQDPKNALDYRNIVVPNATMPGKYPPPYPILERRLETGFTPEQTLHNYQYQRYGLMPNQLHSSKATGHASGLFPQSQKGIQNLPPNYPQSRYYSPITTVHESRIKDFDQNVHLSQLNQMHSRLPHSALGTSSEMLQNLSYMEQNRLQRSRLYYESQAAMAQKSSKMANYGLQDQRTPEAIHNDYLEMTRSCAPSMKPVDYPRVPNPAVAAKIDIAYDPKHPREYVAHPEYGVEHNYLNEQASGYPNNHYSHRVSTKVSEMPPRNISPRRTYQENMPIYVVSPPQASISNHPSGAYGHPDPPTYPNANARNIHTSPIKSNQYPSSPIKYPNRTIPPLRHFAGYQENYPLHQYYQSQHPNVPGHQDNLLRSQSHYPINLMAVSNASRSYPEFQNEGGIFDDRLHHPNSQVLSRSTDYSKKSTDMSKSIKEFLESWEDDEESVANLPDLVLCNNLPPDKHKHSSSSCSNSDLEDNTDKNAEKRKANDEAWYIYGRSVIAPEMLQQYLEAFPDKVVDSLPANIKGFYSTINSLSEAPSVVDTNVLSTSSNENHDSPSPHDLSVNNNFIADEVLNLCTKEKEDTEERNNNSSPNSADKSSHFAKSNSKVNDVPISNNIQVSETLLNQQESLEKAAEKPITASVIVPNTYFESNRNKSDSEPCKEISEPLDNYLEKSADEEDENDGKNSNINNPNSTCNETVTIIESQLIDLDKENLETQFDFDTELLSPGTKEDDKLVAEKTIDLVAEKTIDLSLEHMLLSPEPIPAFDDTVSISEVLDLGEENQATPSNEENESDSIRSPSPKTTAKYDKFESSSKVSGEIETAQSPSEEFPTSYDNGQELELHKEENEDTEVNLICNLSLENAIHQENLPSSDIACKETEDFDDINKKSLQYPPTEERLEVPEEHISSCESNQEITSDFVNSPTADVSEELKSNTTEECLEAPEEHMSSLEGNQEITSDFVNSLIADVSEELKTNATEENLEAPMKNICSFEGNQEIISDSANLTTADVLVKSNETEENLEVPEEGNQEITLDSVNSSTADVLVKSNEPEENLQVSEEDNQEITSDSDKSPTADILEELKDSEENSEVPEANVSSCEGNQEITSDSVNSPTADVSEESKEEEVTSATKINVYIPEDYASSNGDSEDIGSATATEDAPGKRSDDETQVTCSLENHGSTTSSEIINEANVEASSPASETYESCTTSSENSETIPCEIEIQYEEIDIPVTEVVKENHLKDSNTEFGNLDRSQNNEGEITVTTEEEDRCGHSKQIIREACTKRTPSEHDSDFADEQSELKEYAVANETQNKVCERNNLDDEDITSSEEDDLPDFTDSPKSGRSSSVTSRLSTEEIRITEKQAGVSDTELNYQEKGVILIRDFEKEHKVTNILKTKAELKEIISDNETFHCETAIKDEDSNYSAETVIIEDLMLKDGTVQESVNTEIEIETPNATENEDNILASTDEVENEAENSFNSTDGNLSDSSEKLVKEIDNTLNDSKTNSTNITQNDSNTHEDDEESTIYEQKSEEDKDRTYQFDPVMDSLDITIKEILNNNDTSGFIFSDSMSDSEDLNNEGIDKCNFEDTDNEENFDYSMFYDKEEVFLRVKSSLDLLPQEKISDEESNIKDNSTEKNDKLDSDENQILETTGIDSKEIILNNKDNISIITEKDDANHTFSDLDTPKEKIEKATTPVSSLKQLTFNDLHLKDTASVEATQQNIENIKLKIVKQTKSHSKKHSSSKSAKKIDRKKSYRNDESKKSKVVRPLEKEKSRKNRPVDRREREKLCVIPKDVRQHTGMALENHVSNNILEKTSDLSNILTKIDTHPVSEEVIANRQEEIHEGFVGSEAIRQDQGKKYLFNENSSNKTIQHTFSNLDKPKKKIEKATATVSSSKRLTIHDLRHKNTTSVDFLERGEAEQQNIENINLKIIKQTKSHSKKHASSKPVKKIDRKKSYRSEKSHKSKVVYILEKEKSRKNRPVDRKEREKLCVISNDIRQLKDMELDNHVSNKILEKTSDLSNILTKIDTHPVSECVTEVGLNVEEVIGNRQQEIHEGLVGSKAIRKEQGDNSSNKTIQHTFSNLDKPNEKIEKATATVSSSKRLTINDIHHKDTTSVDFLEGDEATQQNIENMKLKIVKQTKPHSKKHSSSKSMKKIDWKKTYRSEKSTLVCTLEKEKLRKNRHVDRKGRKQLCARSNVVRKPTDVEFEKHVNNKILEKTCDIPNILSKIDALALSQCVEEDSLNVEEVIVNGREEINEGFVGSEHIRDEQVEKCNLNENHSNKTIHHTFSNLEKPNEKIEKATATVSSSKRLTINDIHHKDTTSVDFLEGDETTQQNIENIKLKIMKQTKPHSKKHSSSKSMKKIDWKKTYRSEKSTLVCTLEKEKLRKKRHVDRKGRKQLCVRSNDVRQHTDVEFEKHVTNKILEKTCDMPNIPTKIDVLPLSECVAEEDLNAEEVIVNYQEEASECFAASETIRDQKLDNCFLNEGNSNQTEFVCKGGNDPSKEIQVTEITEDDDEYQHLVTLTDSFECDDGDYPVDKNYFSGPVGDISNQINEEKPSDHSLEFIEVKDPIVQNSSAISEDVSSEAIENTVVESEDVGEIPDVEENDEISVLTLELVENPSEDQIEVILPNVIISDDCASHCLILCSENDSGIVMTESCEGNMEGVEIVDDYIGGEVVIEDDGIVSDWVSEEIVIDGTDNIQNQYGSLEKTQEVIKEQFDDLVELNRNFIQEERSYSSNCVEFKTKSSEESDKEKELFINPENPIKIFSCHIPTFPPRNSEHRIKRRVSIAGVDSPKIEFTAPKRRYSELELVRSSNKQLINLDEIKQNVSEALATITKQENMQYKCDIKSEISQKYTFKKKMIVTDNKHFETMQSNAECNDKSEINFYSPANEEILEVDISEKNVSVLPGNLDQQMELKPASSHNQNNLYMDALKNNQLQITKDLVNCTNNSKSSTSNVSVQSVTSTTSLPLPVPISTNSEPIIPSIEENPLTKGDSQKVLPNPSIEESTKSSSSLVPEEQNKSSSLSVEEPKNCFSDNEVKVALPLSEMSNGCEKIGRPSVFKMFGETHEKSMNGTVYREHSITFKFDEGVNKDGEKQNESNERVKINGEKKAKINLNDYRIRKQNNCNGIKKEGIVEEKITGEKKFHEEPRKNVKETKININNNVTPNNLVSIKDSLKVKTPKRRKRRFRNLDAIEEDDDEGVQCKVAKHSLQEPSSRNQWREDSYSCNKNSVSSSVDVNSNGETVENNCRLKCHIKLKSIQNNPGIICDYKINKNKNNNISNLKLTLKPINRPKFSEVLSSLDSVVEQQEVLGEKKKTSSANVIKPKWVWDSNNKVPKVIIKRNASGYCAVSRDVSSNPAWQPTISLKRQKFIEALVTKE